MYGPLPVGTEMCVRRVEENIHSLALTYAPCVSVFPARSGFTPGWVYVHVGGGAACLISHIYVSTEYLLMLWVLVCSQLAPVFPLVGCMSMWVVVLLSHQCGANTHMDIHPPRGKTGASLEHTNTRSISKY